VETAERFADGQATEAELATAYCPARRVSIEWSRDHPADPRQFPMIAPADAAARGTFDAAYSGALDAGWSVTGAGSDPTSPGYAALADLARCVFGNPFHPVPLAPGWCLPAVVSLAHSIYAERAFGRLPELALGRALAASVCEDPDILAHCRDRLHARSCGVIDLLLGLA
jgi:hypothetical protein